VWDVQLHLCQAQNQAQDQEDDEDTLAGMTDYGKPVGPVSLAGECIKQTRQNITGHPPRLVEMLQPEKDGIRDPVPSSKDTLNSDESLLSNTVRPARICLSVPRSKSG
jgi:hypothetical protein